MTSGEKIKTFLRILPYTLPVLAGYLFLGAAYGALMDAIGYGPLWTAVMSVVVYAGSMQYVGVSLLAGAFHPGYAFLLTLMVNARHLFYGVSMLERFAGLGWKKPFLVFWLTDETFSILCSTEPPEGVDRGWFMFTIAALHHCYWIMGGVIGNILSACLRFDADGVDFVMTALFVAIFVGQWRATRNHRPALVGVGASTVCLLVCGGDYFIIPAMALIVAALSLFEKRSGGKEDLPSCG